MNYYPHHIGDFNAATRHLNRMERSIYRDLIEFYYDTEKPIPLDLTLVCRKIIAQTDDELTAVEQVLSEFFEETEIGYKHTRCESVLTEYQNSIHNKRKAGKASAKARKLSKQKEKDELTGVEQPLNECSTLVDNQEPITNNQKPVIRETASRFKKPKPEEIQSYFIEQGVIEWQTESGKFFDYYETVGWTTGKHSKPMKSWKGAANNWLRNKVEFDKEKQINQPGGESFESRHTDTSWINK